jgi:hypothetical protein
MIKNEERQRIYTASVTWGVVDSSVGKLVIVDMFTAEHADTLSDSDIADYGLAHGHTPRTGQLFVVVFGGDAVPAPTRVYDNENDARDDANEWRSQARVDSHESIEIVTINLDTLATSSEVIL